MRSKATWPLQSGTGLVVTNPLPTGWNNNAPSGFYKDNDGWVDAYLRYGLSLEDGARSKLLTPMPMKTPTNASEPTIDGVAFSAETIGKSDKHEFSFDLHFVASSESDFLTKYDLFCTEILRGQYFQLKHAKRLGEVRHFLYDGIEPFQEFRLQMAKFTLSIKEPHPEIRDNRVPNVMKTTP